MGCTIFATVLVGSEEFCAYRRVIISLTREFELRRLASSIGVD